MKKEQTEWKITNFFELHVDKEVAILRFRENMLFPLYNLRVRDRLIDTIDRLSSDPSVKVILMVHNPYITGCREYYKFYRNLTTRGADHNILRRLGNVVNQLILSIVESEKFFIHAGSGEAISLIFNIGLACDYRIVGEDSIFHNPYMELGVLPKGGGPFFLFRKLGRSKSLEMLLFRKNLSAREAFELGVLDQIVPEPWLEESALKAAHRFGQIPSRTLSGIKKLVNYSIHDLKDYLETENQEIWKAGEDYLRNPNNQLDDEFKPMAI